MKSKKRYSHWFLQYAVNPQRIAKIASVIPKPGDLVWPGVGTSGADVVGDTVSEGVDTVVLVAVWSCLDDCQPGSCWLQGLCCLNCRGFCDQRVHALIKQGDFSAHRFTSHVIVVIHSVYITFCPVGIRSRRITGRDFPCSILRRCKMVSSLPGYQLWKKGILLHYTTMCRNHHPAPVPLWI